MFHFLVPFMCAGGVPEGSFGLIVWYLLLTQVPLVLPLQLIGWVWFLIHHLPWVERGIPESHLEFSVNWLKWPKSRGYIRKRIHCLKHYFLAFSFAWERKYCSQLHSNLVISGHPLYCTWSYNFCILFSFISWQKNKSCHLLSLCVPLLTPEWSGH